MLYSAIYWNGTAGTCVLQNEIQQPPYRQFFENYCRHIAEDLCSPNTQFARFLLTSSSSLSGRGCVCVYLFDKTHFVWQLGNYKIFFLLFAILHELEIMKLYYITFFPRRSNNNNNETQRKKTKIIVYCIHHQKQCK